MTWPAPRENTCLLGHAVAETLFADAMAAARLHHAWLLTGSRGIGKATLAFRLARRLLGAPAEDDRDPIFRRIATGAHADLMTIERGYDDKRQRLRTEIGIDDIRTVSAFLRRTPAEGGWRVVVVDGLEDLNRNAANALLKLLEEPPAQAALIMTCHAPGRLLPTIRSRCRMLRLHDLETDTLRTLLAAYAPEMATPEADRLIDLARGSIGATLDLQRGDGVALDALADTVLASPHAGSAAYTVADRVLKAEDGFPTFLDILGRRLTLRARAALDGHLPGAATAAAAVRWVDIAQSVRDIRHQTERDNLDKRQALLAAFSLLSGR